MFARFADDPARLSRPAEYPILKGLVGDLVLRPWFDHVALRAIARCYFPLSRAWAAGLASGESVERFWAELDRTGAGRGRSRDRAVGFLARLAARRVAYEAAAARWEAAVFGAGPGAAEALVAAERARRDAAQRLMSARLGALPLHLARPLPAVRWEVADPATVEARHGLRLRDPDRAFASPEAPAVERSRALPGAYGREHWLRFPSPVLGDMAWARVYEPARTADPPSLVFLHGIGMETEFWNDIADEVSGLAQGGVRVIRPEGPWHGRRRPEGWYGGERATGLGPLGLIELFQAWVAEVAVLVAWARATSRGAVALGGVSLGSLTAQLAATAARGWPAACRPDALLLVATTGRLADLAERGSLARAIGLPARIRAAGWSETEIERWLPLLEPRGAPVMPGANIVMLLGRCDDLTPFDGGAELARRWGVPEANLFQRRQGHFSVSLGLGHDPAPLARLTALLGTARPNPDRPPL
jgi:pimeloyl-ACP methyl ester carboxylesterase